MDYGDFLRSCLGGENEMEWKEIKRIILEYSSLPLFESFNGGNGKLIFPFPCLGVLMERMESSFPCLGV